MTKQKQSYVSIFEPKGIISKKDLDKMVASAVNFLLKDIENLKLFIEKLKEDFEQVDLAFALKMFVLNRNRVFNMTEFMKKQSELADLYVKSHNKTFTNEEKRNMLNRWIEENAAAYRKHTIFKQIWCIDKKASKILPAIKKALKK